MTMMERQQQQHQSQSPSSPPSVEEVLQKEATSSTTQQQQRQPYEELKWTEAPLYCDPTMSAAICHEDEPASASAASSAFVATANNNNTMTTTPVRLPLHGETTALLIVDVQPEYWSHCPSVQQDFPDFPNSMAQTLETCRTRNAKIIWVRADYRITHSPWLVQFERLRGKMPGYMVEVPCDMKRIINTTTDSGDSSGNNVNWEDFATPRGGEVVIPKTSWSSTSDTALKEVLRANGIDTVLVCGLITSVCVQHSAFGVFEAGYRTLLVTDACADRGRARHEAALALYGEYMYELVTSRDLQHPQTGLLPAKPVWLTLDSIRPMSCIHNDHRGGGGGGGGSLTSSSSSSSSSSNSNSGGIVSPLGSFGDLQNALLLADKNTKGNNKENDTTTPTAPSSETTSSSVTSSSLQCL